MIPKPRQHRDPVVTAAVRRRRLRVYFDGTLHLSAPAKGLIVQAYVGQVPDDIDRFFVDLTADRSTVTAEYSTRARFEAVLAAIDGAL